MCTFDNVEGISKERKRGCGYISGHEDLNWIPQVWFYVSGIPLLERQA